MAGKPTSALVRLGAAIAAAAPLCLLAAQPPSLADLSIEELANLEITSVRSSLDIASNQEFDATLRRVGDLPNPPVPEYTAVDLRYGWRVRRDKEIARSVFLRARWLL